MKVYVYRFRISAGMPVTIEAVVVANNRQQADQLAGKSYPLLGELLTDSVRAKRLRLRTEEHEIAEGLIVRSDHGSGSH